MATPMKIEDADDDDDDDDDVREKEMPNSPQHYGDDIEMAYHTIMNIIDT